MSAGGHSRQPSSRSTASSRSNHNARPVPPPVSLTPKSDDPRFDPCAASASFLLYAQRNVILVLHHDTLAIERRFESHREDVVWITVDNSSERGSGRLAVSYDNGNTAIVWDILTGTEIARFSAYERMKVASFMRNGNIAFGNDQGNVILFEPSTSEHISARTIFDPITAIAPAADCRTFAIGYANGSILIATIQPSFTIQHTLTTQRQPSRIMGLAWHGSSSKQKTDMLASQTLEGDLRVWSVPKAPYTEAPNIIRQLQRSENTTPGPCWFAWSKNGRIVQHVEGETRAWDVRTKKVSYEIIPTIDGVRGISVYGPSATLFTLGHGNTVQQYDITPTSTPMQVASVQHAPSVTPPTPPTMLDDPRETYAKGRPSNPDSLRIPMYADVESSADEGALSPLQKITKEMDSIDTLESESRDKVMPLSPTSSRASSTSSRSSGYGRKSRKYLYDQPSSSRASSDTGYEETEFSFGGAASVKQGHESMSIRSVSSYQSRPRHRQSSLRKEILRSPDETKAVQNVDLFPFTKARLRDVAFRTPQYGNGARTPELLQREMLSVVFGWEETARELVRDELGRHRPGSAAAVLLSKWVGGMGADDMAAMIGSETMTSADWMLLALSSIGSDSQKQVGEAFVQRLLEKGDIHPAAAILLGLKEPNEAIEIYVSQGCWMEAVLLTCLESPSDWQRQSYLIRKWGEHAVQNGQPELAVRCFSCTSVETSEPWFSPRAQDAAYTAQQERLTGMAGMGPTSPPLSPPSRSGSGRLTAKNASLKLITNFGSLGAVGPHTADVTPMVVGATPIAESALSPGGAMPWRKEQSRLRDPSSARTATPGGYARRKRLPSKSDIERAKQDVAELATPMTAARDYAPKAPSQASHSRRTSNASTIPEPLTSLRPTVYNPMDEHLPSPAQGAFTRLRGQSKEPRSDRKPEGLAVQIVNPHFDLSRTQDTASVYSEVATSTKMLSPPLTAGSAKARAINEYINSVEEARTVARQERNESRRRGESRRPSDAPATSDDQGITYIPPGKRSPSSPVSMSAANVGKVAVEGNDLDGEDFYKRASVTESESSLLFSRNDKPVSPNRQRARSRAQSRAARGSDEDKSRGDRGRSASRKGSLVPRSPNSPLADANEKQNLTQQPTTGDNLRSRARSSSRKPVSDEIQSRRGVSRGVRERSSSRRPKLADGIAGLASAREERMVDTSNDDDLLPLPRFQGLSRKELAAKELQERRLSLARRPSAPTIPLPGELAPNPTRPQISPRSYTDNVTTPYSAALSTGRSQTVDPEAMSKYNRTGSTTLPQIGLPATPRAMRHPRYMSADPNEREGIPPVPDLPMNPSELSSFGGSVTGSSLSSVSGAGGSVLSTLSTQAFASEAETDDVGPLLPSTVFGQKGPQAPPRSASAPPEKSFTLPSHPAYKPSIPNSHRRQSSNRGPVRKISPPETISIGAMPANITSIDQALHDNDQVIIIQEDSQPILLPELQHLAGPPPPPPPPVYTQGMINIAVGDNAQSRGIVEVMTQTGYQPTDRAMTVSPASTHRRDRGSVSETFGNRLRGVTERMRSSSRSRAKSPAFNPLQTSPYETVLPPIPGYGRQDVVARAKSPYEQAVAAGQVESMNAQVIPPPPPPPMAPLGADGRLSETSIPPTIVRPSSRSQSAVGYRNPKEIRANMPPGSVQGSYISQGGFL